MVFTLGLGLVISQPDPVTISLQQTNCAQRQPLSSVVLVVTFTHPSPASDITLACLSSYTGILYQFTTDTRLSNCPAAVCLELSVLHRPAVVGSSLASNASSSKSSSWSLTLRITAVAPVLGWVPWNQTEMGSDMQMSDWGMLLGEVRREGSTRGRGWPSMWWQRRKMSADPMEMAFQSCPKLRQRRWGFYFPSASH